jgi:hypothetical protein
MVNLVFNLSHLKGDVAGIQRMEELIIEALDEEVCNVIDWETHDGKLYVSCLHFPVKTTYFGCYWYTTKIAKKNEIAPIDKIVTEIKEVNGQAVHVVRLLEDGETRPDAGFLTPKEAMPI